MLETATADAPAGVVARYLDFLATVRRRYDGDADRYLILLALTVAAREAVRPETAMGDCVVSALSVAGMTGIPRETARRKLAHMVEEGAIESPEPGLYRMRDPQFGDALIRDLGRLAALGTLLRVIG